MHHDLKLMEKYEEVKRDGRKPWEFRSTSDRDFQVGDTVTFHIVSNDFAPWDRKHLGRSLGPVRITYVLPSQGSTLPPKTVIFTHTAVMGEAPDMPLEPHGFEGLDEIAEPVSYTVNKGFRRTKIGQETLFDADPDCEHDIQAKPNGGVGCVKCGGWFCF